MYLPPITTPQITSDAWLSLLTREARHSGFEHLDVLIDATGLDYPLHQQLGLLIAPPRHVRLFDHTPEHALKEGPVLLRVELDNSGLQGWLSNLLAYVHGDHRVLVLLSQWPLERLGAHLRHFTQVSWNNNTRHGVLRYYDPRQFEAVCNGFDRAQCEHFHAAMDRWFWVDREGEPREYDGRCWQAHPRQDPLADKPPPAPLQLTGTQLELMNRWRDAEAVRVELNITAESVKARSKGALRDKLTMAVATLGKEACLADKQLVHDWLVSAFAATRNGGTKP